MAPQIEQSRANFFGFSRSLVCPGDENFCQEDDAFLLVDTGAETRLNRLIVKRPFTAADRTRLDELLAHFRDLRETFSVVIPEEYVTAEFLDVARDRYLGTGSMLNWPVMVRAKRLAPMTADGSRCPPVGPRSAASLEGTAIRRVEDPEDLQQWSLVVSDAFSTTPEPNETLRKHLLRCCSPSSKSFHYYMLDDGGVTVSASAIFHEEHSDSVGLYWVATSRRERGKGHARALNEWVMQAHGGAGDVYLQAMGVGLKLYESLGFARLEVFKNFIPGRGFFAKPSPSDGSSLRGKH